MGKFIKKFAAHTDYAAAESGLIKPNVSYCVQERDVHYNSIIPPTILLTFTLSQPSSNERLGIFGDLSPFNGSADADGLKNVASMKIDGVEIDMENDITDEVIIDGFARLHLSAHTYNFETAGEHTVEYTLKEPIINEGLLVGLGR